MRGAGFGLDEKAIDAAKNWRFLPGQYQGKPVPVAFSSTLKFSLPEFGAPSAAMRFDLPDNAARPVLEEGTLSQIDLPDIALMIRFRVTKEGTVEGIKGTFQPLVDRVSGWHFRPARFNGRSVATDATLELWRAS